MRATLTGWTSAGPTTTSGPTKTSRTCKRHSLTLMWKARLSELEFDERELAEVLDAIDSEWITAGPRTQVFEKACAQFTYTSEAVDVSNGTAGLFLALIVL